MKRQEFTRGQVLLAVIVFVLLMGVVGKIDHDSQQALIKESGRFHVATGLGY